MHALKNSLIGIRNGQRSGRHEATDAPRITSPKVTRTISIDRIEALKDASRVGCQEGKRKVGNDE